MIAVRLEPDEMRAAIRYGAEQFLRALTGDFNDPTNKRRRVSVEIEGIGAELAFAKWRGIPWDNDLDRFKRPDVGRAQIRQTERPRGRLIFRPHDGDSPDEPFVLVVGTMPRYSLVGWLWGREVVERGSLEAPGGRPPAYFAAQERLRPLT